MIKSSNHTSNQNFRTAQQYLPPWPHAFLLIEGPPWNFTVNSHHHLNLRPSDSPSPSPASAQPLPMSYGQTDLFSWCGSSFRVWTGLAGPGLRGLEGVFRWRIIGFGGQWHPLLMGKGLKFGWAWNLRGGLRSLSLGGSMRYCWSRGWLLQCLFFAINPRTNLLAHRNPNPETFHGSP